MAENTHIAAVQRAMDIIELLDSEGEMGITDIARRLSMAKSGVHKTINTLKSRHYIKQDPSSQKYSNSYKFFEIGNNVARRTSLPQLAIPFMLQLSKSFKCSANLGVLEGQSVCCLHRIESDATVKVTIRTGQFVPLHCTGLGKAIISQLPLEELETMFKDYQFTVFTHNTINNFQDLLKDLEEVRKRGYSVDNEEHNNSILGIASPIFNAAGKPIASMSVAMAIMANVEKPDIETIGHVVRNTAQNFTVSLGGKIPGLHC